MQRLKTPRRLCAHGCMSPSRARPSSNGSSGTRPIAWRRGRFETAKRRRASPPNRAPQAVMNPQIVGAIVAMVSYGLADFIYKQAAAAGVRADHFLLAQAWFFCPLVILYALATGTLVLDSAALWGSLAGAFVFAGFYYFVRSLAAGSVSTNAAIFRMNFIVTAALVIALLGEPLTQAKIAGLALALLATWLLVGAGSSPKGAPDDRRRRSLVEGRCRHACLRRLEFLPHRRAAARSRPGNACGCAGGTVHAARNRGRVHRGPQASAAAGNVQIRLRCRDRAARRHHLPAAQRRAANPACWCRSRRWGSSSPRCSAFSCCASASRPARRSGSLRRWPRWPCWRGVEPAQVLADVQSNQPPPLPAGYRSRRTSGAGRRGKARSSSARRSPVR